MGRVLQFVNGSSITFGDETPGAAAYGSTEYEFVQCDPLIFMQHPPQRPPLFGDTDDMRRCVDFVCQTCGHQWTQPSRSGRCPACHDNHVIQMEHRYCSLPRS